MPSVYEDVTDEDITRAAINVVANIRDVRRACQHIIDNPENGLIIDYLDMQLKRTRKALQGRVDGPIDVDIIGARMQAKITRFDWLGSEKAKFNNLLTTLIPEFLLAIDSNLGLVMSFYTLHPTEPGLISNPMTGPARNAIVALCEGVISATDLAES